MISQRLIYCILANSRDKEMVNEAKPSESREDELSYEIQTRPLADEVFEYTT